MPGRERHQSTGRAAGRARALPASGEDPGRMSSRKQARGIVTEPRGGRERRFVPVSWVSCSPRPPVVTGAALEVLR